MGWAEWAGLGWDRVGRRGVARVGLGCVGWGWGWVAAGNLVELAGPLGEPVLAGADEVRERRLLVHAPHVPQVQLDLPCASGDRGDGGRKWGMVVGAGAADRLRARERHS